MSPSALWTNSVTSCSLAAIVVDLLPGMGRIVWAVIGKGDARRRFPCTRAKIDLFQTPECGREGPGLAPRATDGHDGRATNGHPDRRRAGGRRAAEPDPHT